MSIHRTLSLTLLCAGLAVGTARAQSTQITTGPNGQLSGSVSAGGAPPISMSAGGGQVSGGVARDPGMVHNGRGRSMTVRSPDGSSSTSVWTSGPGATAMAGAGSPGSTITTSDDEPQRTRFRRHVRHHGRHVITHRRHRR